MKNIFLIITVCSILGCSANLDLKPDSTLVLPKTARDFESILDNSEVINKTPALAQLSADEYFIPSMNDYQALPSSIARNTYTWQKDIFEGQTKILDWSRPFNAIFYCNSVIDVISEKDIATDSELKNIKGWALFARAYSFYTLASIYAKAYDEATALTDLGIPLKFNSNIDELVERSTVQATYDQIIKDAIEASNLLKENITQDKRNRPSKVAAFAFLARVYLSMRKYDQAELYADKSLALYSTLIDFNTLNTTARSAFTYNSAETIYFSDQIAELSTTSYSTSIRYGVDTNLIHLYPSTDLRLKIYFKVNSVGNYNNKGINSANSYPFTGLATDEMYLIKAECLARRQQKDEALALLNILLRTRMETGTFEEITAANSDEALEKVLIERRKSLVWRSLRWTDLKRLNLEGRNIKLTRNLSGQEYVLEPNSPRYVMPIPDDEIILSGIKQNVR